MTKNTTLERALSLLAAVPAGGIWKASRFLDEGPAVIDGLVAQLQAATAKIEAQEAAMAVDGGLRLIMHQRDENLTKLEKLRRGAKGLYDALDADPSNQDAPIWDAHEALNAVLKEIA